MLQNHIRVLLSVVMASLAIAASAQNNEAPRQDPDETGTKRVALVIGNTHYAVGGLQNPELDARAMTGALKEIGFDTTLLLDADRRSMVTAIQEFSAKLHRKNAFGFFYYSGHGAQYQGRNFLVPIGYDIHNPEDLDGECVDLNRLLGALKAAGNGANVVVLDACRDNPFASARGFADRGLASVNAPVGTFIAYATAPGETATDSGIYRECLIRNIKQPGVQVEQAFKRTRVDMVTRTQGSQVPWDASSLVSDYFLVPGSAPEPSPDEKPSVETLASWVEKGDKYRDGKGVTRDYVEAVKWYRKAADAGSAAGTYNVGRMYDRGWGLAQDFAQAMLYYRRAADDGEPRAQNNLGIMYLDGKGVEKDYPLALELFRKCAHAGDSRGLTNLGYMHQYGYGVKANIHEAVTYYEAAANLGDVFGTFNLGTLYRDGLGVPQNQRKALELFRTAANLGHPRSAFEVGNIYERGRAVDKDLTAAIAWYKKGAELGSSDCVNALKRLHADQ